MKKGPYRSLIPTVFCETDSWPKPDELAHIPRKELYFRRKEAVKMYASDVPFGEIRYKTGLSKDEVERLVTRCVIADGAGNIYGFRALIPNFRINAYSRRANTQGVSYADRGGSAGALTMLHDQFNDVAENIEELLLKKSLSKGKSTGQVHEARIPYKELHKKWLTLLRQKGLTDNDWPFNRHYHGYRSFVTYCHTIRNQHLARFITARSGIEAGRKNGIGQGLKPLLPSLRAYTYVQLDFHKVDAASIIVIRNEFGVEFEIPIARWHIGLLAEEKSHAVLEPDQYFSVKHVLC